MKDPCELCLVKACCKILKGVWFDCGCDPYEIYKTYQSLYKYCSHNEYLTQLMMDQNQRMKKINFENKQL